MSASKKRYSFVTLLLFALAIGLLLFSTIGSTRAALTVQSEVLESDFEMLDIGVELDNEKGPVSGSALLDGMIGTGEKLKAGKEYARPVSVTNTGNIDEYVRLVLYKYWCDAKGNKTTVFDTDLIELGYAGGWTKDSSAPASYDEREIWYYTAGPLTPGQSVPFLSTLTINDDIYVLVTQETVGNKIITTYAYDGAIFCVEIEADGVQTHNAQDAIKSAWGKSVTVTDGGPITGGIG